MSDDNEDILEEEFDVKKVKEVLVDIEDDADPLADPLLDEVDPEELEEDDAFSLYDTDDDTAEFSY